MSQEIGGSITQMQWRPPMIRLTQIPNPDVDDGEPTQLYVDPSLITVILRVYATHKSRKEGDADWTFAMPAGCWTDVFIHGGYSHLVMESPEQVAVLRDRALGCLPAMRAGKIDLMEVMK